MKNSRAFKSLIFSAALIFVSVTIGRVHAQDRERDMPNEITPADSAGRELDAPGQDKSIKERMHVKEGEPLIKKQDNSRYSTDGTERYESDKEVSGTGPKREGRY